MSIVLEWHAMRSYQVKFLSKIYVQMIMMEWLVGQDLSYQANYTLEEGFGE